jgi:DNA-binding NarL/FixJ family response regulator
MTLRIVIADREAATRLALRMLLHEEPGLLVVGQVGDGQQLLHSVRETHPDLVLLDWDLPGPPIETLLSDLQALNERPAVIVLGARQELRNQTLAAGADYFVHQGHPPKHLLAAIRDIDVGQQA